MTAQNLSALWSSWVRVAFSCWSLLRTGGRRASRWARLCTVVALVPAAFGLCLCLPGGLALPIGVNEALGCSGGGNVPRPMGWTWLKPKQVATSDRTSVSIATDGFFLIDAEGNDLSAARAEETMVVKVTDQGGAEVAGKLKLLKEHRPGWYLFAWTAQEPLAMGARLSVALQAEPAASVPVGGQFELVVAGPPTLATTASLSLTGWSDFYHAVGEPITCEIVPYGAGCGGPQTVVASVPGGLIKQLAGQALWSLPPVVGDVAWEARLEASPEQPDAVVPLDAVTYLTNPEQTELGLGLIAFPTKAERYCVTFVVTDLRTQDEVRSEVCDEPEPADGATTDSSVTTCVSPPNEAVTEGWCAVRVDSELPVCLAVRSGSTPSGGMTADAAADNDAAPRTSKGCEFGGSRAGTGWTLALLALALSRRFRRL